MNTFSAVGRVVADAELHTTDKGKVCRVHLAFDFGSGERRGSFFMNASIWRGSEQLTPRLTKGAEVHVSGEQSVRDYTTRDGKQGQSLDLAVDRVGRIRQPQDRAATGAAPAGRPAALQDEIPF